MTITHRFITTNGIRMHLAEAGEGPLVLLCHGFPECWYSWRSQLEALAAAGFHAVAPDMRGYGQTDKPVEIGAYSIFHLAGDMVGLLDALETETAVIVGHDWGAAVAWSSALFRPDRFRAVVGLSVPFFPRRPTAPSLAMPQTDDAVFYQLYFQEPGIAEARFEKDVRRTIRETVFAWSGDNPERSAQALTMVPRTGSWLTGRRAPTTLPAWLSESDIDYCAAQFEAGGFAGPLNWYRNIDRNWEMTAAWHGAKIRQPALYMVGEHDLLLTFRGMDKLVPNLRAYVPLLLDTILVPGCGHWIQRERAGEVNAALLRFLHGLG